MNTAELGNTVLSICIATLLVIPGIISNELNMYSGRQKDDRDLTISSTKTTKELADSEPAGKSHLQYNKDTTMTNLIIRKILNRLDNVIFNQNKQVTIHSLSLSVMVSGNITGTSGAVPFTGMVIATDPQFNICNYSFIDKKGYYKFGLQANLDYILVAITGSASNVGGYYLSGYLPWEGIFT